MSLHPADPWRVWHDPEDETFYVARHRYTYQHPEVFRDYDDAKRCADMLNAQEPNPTTTSPKENPND